MIKNILKHWPTVLLGVIIAVILLIAVFSYQLNETEKVVITTFGRPSVETQSGLHFRWPFPFQRVYRFDKRIRCFEGGAGKLEETITADNQNILVSIFVNFKIGDVEKFFTSLENMSKAEDQLNSWMRGAKNAAFGQYRFGQIINVDPKLMKLNEIQEKIKLDLIERTKNFGLEIVSVGINAINVPKAISDKVFDRMVQDRNLQAQTFLAQGNREAEEIRIKVDGNREKLLADAEAQAREIRASGDAEAAQYYSVFKENPDLAEFLRKLDSLKTIMKSRTTLVLDTNVAPFDLFHPSSAILPSKTLAPKK